MNVTYNGQSDLLYIRFDEKKQEIINKKISDDVVLDMGEGERIVGLEILNASKNLSLQNLLPIKYEMSGLKALVP